MRVLIWAPHVTPGGGERLLLSLAPAIAAEPRVERTILAIPPSIYGNGDFEQGGEPPLEVIRLPAPRLVNWLRRDAAILGLRGTRRLRLSLRWRTERALLDRARQAQIAAWAGRADVVYAFWPHMERFPLISRPVVCTFQDATYFEFPELLGAAHTLRERRRAAEWLAGSARVIVSSEATKAIAQRHFGDPAASAIVIHHAVSPRREGQASHPTRPPEGLPQRYVVYPANTTAHKNHFLLLAAWARYPRRQEAPLVMFGHGTEVLRNDWRLEDNIEPQQDRLWGLVRRLGLREGADYYAFGYIGDTRANAVVAGAWALIMPSLAEGGGSFPVEEALSLGVPVLCSDIPVMREHMSQRSARIAWFDPLSTDSILQAIGDVERHYPDFKAAALRGANDPRPTWQEIASRYVDVFETALRDPTPSAPPTGKRPGFLR